MGLGVAKMLGREVLMSVCRGSKPHKGDHFLWIGELIPLDTMVFNCVQDSATSPASKGHWESSFSGKPFELPFSVIFNVNKLILILNESWHT